MPTRRKSRKSEKKSQAAAGQPKLDIAGGEAAGILEFSFGYDVWKNIRKVAEENLKLPGSGDQDDIAAAGGGQQEQAGYSSGFFNGMFDNGEPSELFDTPLFQPDAEGSNGGGDGFGLSYDEQLERDEDLICPKCKSPSLIWVKNFLQYERKWYGVLFQLCRDWKCAKFTGKIKRTQAPAFLSDTDTTRFGPPIWTDEGLKYAEEMEALGKPWLPAIMDQFEDPNSQLGDNRGGGSASELGLGDEIDVRKELANLKLDKDVQDMVDAALGYDPDMGLPNPFAHPFDLEGVRALTGMPDSELIKNLHEVFPEGIPNLARTLGV